MIKLKGKKNIYYLYETNIHGGDIYAGIYLSNRLRCHSRIIDSAGTVKRITTESNETGQSINSVGCPFFVQKRRKCNGKEHDREFWINQKSCV